MDRFGHDIEFDLHHYFGLDFLDWFRGKYPWPKLLRLLTRLPPESHYQAARAMDREIAEAIIDLPRPEKAPMSPQGFSQSIHLQMSILESIRMLDNTLRRVNGNNSPAPRPLERPVTALQVLERERDCAFVDGHLERLGVV